MFNANMARLVDLLEYRLNVDYASWITNPSEAKRARARAERDGIKPPPFPLVPPVALRPPSVHAELQAEHDDLTAQFSRRPASRAEFDAALGVESAETQLHPDGRHGSVAPGR